MCFLNGCKSVVFGEVSEKRFLRAEYSGDLDVLKLLRSRSFVWMMLIVLIGRLG